MATVAGLAYYPVKGCTAVLVATAMFTLTGITHDRALMLVDERGRFLSQRVAPPMAVIRPTVSADGSRLTLTAPGMADAGFDVSFDGDRLPVSLFDRWFGSGVDQGDAVAKWFGEVLDRRCRLVRVPPEHDRDGWGEHPGKVGFADAHPVLLTAQSSLDELNRRITEQHGASPVPMNRFRPNIVVAGWPTPFTEDRVRLATVGGVELGYATRAIRCAVPTIAQETGQKSGPEPTRTLAGFRREPDGGVSFGMKAAVLKPGRVAVGDEITVTRWG